MQAVQQGDLSLLQQPAAQEMLQSKIPARVAYVGTDGAPRVVPIWFHWNGREIVMASPLSYLDLVPLFCLCAFYRSSFLGLTNDFCCKFRNKHGLIAIRAGGNHADARHLLDPCVVDFIRT